MQRVALIGAGAMSNTHATAYSAMPNAELVAVCDIFKDAAQAMADKYAVKAFWSIDELLSSVDVDVIDICTPTPTHADYIKIAAKAGKHVCCEKPMCRTVEQAEEAAKACEDAGVTLFVGQVLRWFPEFKRAHDLIESGAVGTPVMVRTSRGGKTPRSANSWFLDKSQSGGVTLDLIIHDFDWLRWCFGNVKRVYARGLYNAGMPVDYSLVTLRFENGVIAHVEGNWARPSGFKVNVEITGTDGQINFRNDDYTPVVIEERSETASSGSVIVPVNPTMVNPYYKELEHFLSCLESGEKPLVTPQDGIEAVRIAEAAITSITTGEPVELA